MPAIYKDGFYYGKAESDFDLLENRPQKDVTSLVDLITPMPVPTHYRGNLGCSPVGTIISVMGTTAPNHYLACEGQVVSIGAYPELANYFEQQFGTKNYFGGDGTTTFGIPDLRGEFLRGTGTNSHENQGSGGNVGDHQDGTLHVNLLFNTSNGIPSVLSDRTIRLIDRDYDYSTNGYYCSDLTQRTTDNKERANGSSYTSRPTNTSVLWCIQAVSENTYSTDEKIVGTWIDGKPIWQNTVSTGGNVPSGATLILRTAMASTGYDTILYTKTS